MSARRCGVCHAHRAFLRRCGKAPALFVRHEWRGLIAAALARRVRASLRNGLRRPAHPRAARSHSLATALLVADTRMASLSLRRTINLACAPAVNGGWTISGHRQRARYGHNQHLTASPQAGTGLSI
jgi:hypothetical protein